ncbi:MAG TPA: LysR family transcriptional regulator, partial [Polyangiaceae bacterium]|nr:LysR family transcriptional regulator [Polyangiaceae bacterium]
MHIPWDDIQLFLAVAEGGSLSAAARKLGVGQPTVSRRIAALEAQLSERLFERSADGTTLTAAAEQLLAPARRMAESAGELMRGAERGDAAPQGVVRLTAPPGIAFDFVAPFAASLRSRLPAVRLEVRSSIQYLDLSRREADLALRMRPAEER